MTSIIHSDQKLGTIQMSFSNKWDKYTMLYSHNRTVHSKN